MITIILQWAARIAIGLIILGLAVGVATFIGAIFAMCANSYKDKKDGQLPWHCMLTDTPCRWPDEECENCEVFIYFRYEEEADHGPEDFMD